MICAWLDLDELVKFIQSEENQVSFPDLHLANHLLF